MQKPTRTPSRGSQITFKNKDEVYTADKDEATLVSSKGRSSSSTNNKGSKASVKESKVNAKDSKASVKESKSSVKSSKSSVKEGSSKTKPGKVSKNKSADQVQGPGTSTPEGSAKDLDISVSPIEPSGDGQDLQAEPTDYIPMPYTFRTPTLPPSKELTRFPAKCPPYYLQLDHTLAVIWALYTNAEMKKPLGIVQLQWALTFLNGIYNQKGEYTKDIALCIQTIEDALIEQYAEMVDEVQFIKKPPERVTDLRSRSRSKEQNEKAKEKGKKGKSKKKSSESMKTQSQIDMEAEMEETGETSEPEKDTEEEPVKTGGLCTPKRSANIIRPPRGLHPTSTPYDEDAQKSGDECDEDSCSHKSCVHGDERDELTMRQVPFSINYAEMINRSPPDVEQLFPSTASFKATSVGSGPKKSISGMDRAVSRDDMMDFLKAWRKEQVDKIEAELKRLKSIENFIGNADAENFEPYLDDKQLDSLLNKKVSSSGRPGKDKPPKKKSANCCRP